MEEILSTKEGAAAFAKWAPETELFNRRFGVGSKARQIRDRYLGSENRMKSTRQRGSNGVCAIYGWLWHILSFFQIHVSLLSC